MKRLSLAVALIAASAASQVSMQMPMPMIADWSYAGTVSQQIFTSQLNELISRQALSGPATSNQDKNGSSSAISPSDRVERSVQLDFTPSMQRRRVNYAGFVERSRRADPAGADSLAETLRSDPITMMQPELAKVGLRVDNVADAYAVYWVEAWQAVHGVTGASSRETAQAVREQAVGAIGATPVFASATAAQKQEFAESYLIQALLVGAAKKQAGGDPGKLAQVPAAVEQGVRAAGLDLRAMTLTEEGFRPAG